MITAETITDEQIRELRDEAWDAVESLDKHNAIVTDCSLALAKFRDPTGLQIVRDARARCAEILNARARGEGEPITKVQP